MRRLTQTFGRDARFDRIDQVPGRLDARLETGVERPLALALSGGGDSLALLWLAADWAASRGRRLLALTVDHRLSPDSALWTRRAQIMAHDAGVDWQGLSWDQDRPDPTAPGLAAAARVARHALIARAARGAGARVILMAHTADDVAEGDWMRAHGSTLGALREWAPSPVWPQGRGLMLLRPLLDVRRDDLRAFLSMRGLDWIEDPANADPRFLRARARDALCGERPPPGAARTPVSGTSVATSDVTGDAWTGVRVPAGADRRTLAAALVAAGGGDRPPRGERLARLHARLAMGEAFKATLCGAALAARDGAALIVRDAGRIDPRPRPLAAGRPTIWDGRFRVVVDTPGWAIVAARGRQARLAPAERAILARRPAASRAATPVLIRDDASVTVLARPDQAQDLVALRLVLALDETPHERDVAARADGAAVIKPLSA